MAREAGHVSTNGTERYAYNVFDGNLKGRNHPGQLKYKEGYGRILWLMTGTSDGLL
jgi:hypothetical protein